MPGTRERNERLAEAMSRAGLTSADLAAAVPADPRTIDRLVADRTRTPRPHARLAIAETVRVPVGVLWPSASTGAESTSELVAVYPSRAAVPTGLVMTLLGAATRQVDLLAYAATWVWDAIDGFGSMLANRAQDGVAVRVCLGNPEGEAIAERGAEEGIGDLLAARCRLAATYAVRALQESPAEIRGHDTTLYASILRFDDDLLVNWHLFGAAASESPVFQFRNGGSYGPAERVVASFERVWGLAQPSAL